MESRGERSKRQILETTQKLLANLNPDKVSLDLISKKCKLAKSSILWHFHSKEELMLAVVSKTFEDFISHFENKYENMAPIEKLDRFFDEYTVFAKERPEANIIILTFMVQGNSHKKIKEKLKELFQYFRMAFLQSLDLPNEESMKYRVSFIIAALDGFFLQWLLDPDEIVLEKAYGVVKSFIVDSMKKEVGE